MADRAAADRAASETRPAPFRLWQNPGWGSAIVEAQLAFYGMPYELVEAGDIYTSEPARAALGEINPMRQIPVLQLPSGEMMTESAAMTLHLADLAGSDALVPGPGAAERAAFLRWLVFLVANVYAAVNYSDRAEDYLSDPAVVETFRREVAGQKARLWSQVSEAVRTRGGPWMLGRRFTALDIYMGVMAHWQPGRAWFAAELPELFAVAEAVAERPELKAVFARNFP